MLGESLAWQSLGCELKETYEMNVQEAINAGPSKETSLASRKFKTQRIEGYVSVRDFLLVASTD